jgi:hypothetical protein
MGVAGDSEGFQSREKVKMVLARVSSNLAVIKLEVLRFIVFLSLFADSGIVPRTRFRPVSSTFIPIHH